MRKPFLIALAVAVTPLATQAETINLYGWQNHSWEFVDEKSANGDRSYDRMNSNAGNIGFSASVDTGLNGIKVNLQCEQFTFYNQFANSTASTWCNRNSKIGLAHPQAGEIMFATWLLPYNEGVAQWVDPFYDAGADSHTNVMGSVGAGVSSTFYNPVFGRTNGFNRRQENIIQYWSPNWNGFVFRFAWTLGYRDESKAPRGGGEIDPVIRSSSLAYTNGPVWLAVTWQDHEDWTAASVGEMASSDAESWRLAGRYIADLGDGMSVQISAMYEDLEYEFNNVTSITDAMSAFGFPNVDSAYNTIRPVADAEKNYSVYIRPMNDDDMDMPLPPRVCLLGPDNKAEKGCNNKVPGYDLAKDKLTDAGGAEAIAAKFDRIGTMQFNSEGENVKIEREAWMVSGKIKFGGPVDFRFSYMDADDLEISCGVCGGDWSDTAADAWNVGLFYTMPAGTELRLTYSEVDSDDNSGYGQSIPGTGVGSPGSEVEMFALGIVHWFD